MLRLAGAITNIHSTQQSATPSESLVIDTNDPPEHQMRQVRPRSPSKKLQDLFKYDKIRDSHGRVRDTLLVIAILIVTATYQAVLSPPGGVWQDDFSPSSNMTDVETKQSPPHRAGKTMMGTHNSVSCGLFLVFNSLGFFMSIHMINFLTVGYPLHLELQLSLLALTATYDTCMVALTPTGKLFVLFVTVYIAIPLMLPLLTRMVRDYPRRWR